MTNEIAIDYSTDLVNARLLAALITFNGRCFEAEVDLEGGFTIQSQDNLPVPIYVLWWGYQVMHARAVELQTGKKPNSDQPELQITSIASGDKTANEKIVAGMKSGILLKSVIAQEGEEK